MIVGVLGLADEADTLMIEPATVEPFKKNCSDIYLSFLECVAFINSRKMEKRRGDDCNINRLTYCCSKGGCRKSLA